MKDIRRLIETFVKIWDNHKEELEDKYKKELPSSYQNIVKEVFEMINEHHEDYSDEYEKPDPERMTVIDHGDYQGTQLFIVAADNYQPSLFWRVFVSYGSCSGCDTLEGIKSEGNHWEDDYKPTEQQVKDVMSLALHILQNIKSFGAWDD
jgi:hypothetical protein